MRSRSPFASNRARALAVAIAVLPAIAMATECGYVAASGVDSVAILDLTTSELVGVVPVGERPVGVTVRPGGDEVYITSSESRAVSVLETRTNRVVASIGVGIEPIAIAFAADGRTAYVTNRSSNVVAVIDTLSRKVVENIRTPAGPAEIVIAPNGSTAFTANHIAGSVSFLDLPSARVTHSLRVGESPFFLSQSSSSGRLWVSNVASANLSVIDPGTESVETTIPTGGFPSSIVALADDNRVVVTNAPADGWLTVVDEDSHRVADSRVVDELGSLAGAALSLDGSRLYVSEFVFGNVFVVDSASLDVVELIAVGGGSALARIAVADVPYGCRGDAGACPGDCDASDRVDVAEIVRAVNIALGKSAVEICPAADIDGSGSVSVNELIAIVRTALQGCRIPNGSGHVRTFANTKLGASARNASAY
jgi:YVTN family beta-propeller protein